MKQKEKQPSPKAGFEFTGWATFNWGICHNRVFRTRSEAKEWLVGRARTGDEKWEDMKAYMKIVKVKCTVL